MLADGKCPRCGSPDPKLHPAMQYEGEVELCQHRYHSPAAIPAIMDGNQAANMPLGMNAYAHLSGSAMNDGATA